MSDSDLVDLSGMLVDVAAEAACAVADALREAFRAPMAVDYKRDEHDPVTVHDKRAEEAIREILLRRVPDSTIVGEEGGSHGSGRVHWYVDPIDGTSNFAGGLAFFCTSVGAVVDGTVVAGAINDPMAGNLFTASLDGAFVDGRPLRSSGYRDESRALLLTSYPASRTLAVERAPALDRLGWLIDGYGTVRRVGSAALSLAHVAAGWADVAFGTSVNPWDVAAAHLLVRQAGGCYVPLWFGDAESGPPITAPGYLAHVPELQPSVVDEVIDDIGRSRGRTHRSGPVESAS